MSLSSFIRDDERFASCQVRESLVNATSPCPSNSPAISPIALLPIISNVEAFALTSRFGVPN